MRSAVFAAAFAAGALAVPHQKRAVETDTDVVVVYATDIVTVTAGAPSSSVAVAAETTVASSSSVSHYGHRWQPWTTTIKSSSAAPASTSIASVSSAPAPSSYEAPSSSAAASTSTYVAPSSTYVAPTTSSTSVAPPSSTSAAASSTQAATTSAAASAVPTSYQEITVYHHNIHRSNHSAPDLAWDAGLASTAATIAASCVYAHNVDQDGGGYGQNIAAGVESNNISAIITDLFYNGEVGWYDGLYGATQPNMTDFEHWGHFSQIVWKDTTHVGCATQDCSANGLANVGSDVSPYFTVCNYKNPGNYANEYGVNVGSPLNRATAQWNAGGIS
ncbi:hypothetical protein LTR08_009024 [Meristemomyces frigidus]|nr:hypothetical protein LTR08_009024 [Meristemomyces frigidus]